jgi:multiple sugar transport system substrate-binding protein
MHLLKKISANLAHLNAKLLFVVLGIALVSAGCGTTTAKPKPYTLTVWGTFETSAQMAPVIAAYEKANPSATVIYDLKSYDTYEQELLQAFASGTGPDVYEIHNDWLPKYQQYLQPAPSSVIDVQQLNNNFAPVVANDFIGSDGKIYALPLSIDDIALYYNKDILGGAGIATPPKTWDELDADVKLITKQNSTGFFTKSGVAMGTTSNIERPEDILYLLVLQNGAVPYQADHSSMTLDQSIQEPDGSQFFPASGAIQFYTNFANPASPYYTWNASSNYSSDAFADGQLAFMYGYQYEQGIVAGKAPNLNYGITEVPQPNLTQNPVYFASYWGFGVSKQSKQGAAAWNFINGITSESIDSAYTTANKLPSPRLDVIQAQQNDPTIGVFAYQALNAKSFWKIDAVQTDTIFTSLIDNVTLHGESIQTALTGAMQQVDNVLSQ